MTSRWLALAAFALFTFSCSSAPVGPNVMTAPHSAQEVAAEIERTKQVTPLPPGAAWKAISLDPDSGYGDYAGASMIEFQAMCAWLIEAREATAAGDAARTATAVAVLQRIPTWRSFSDPELMDEGGRTLIRNNIRDAQAGNFHNVNQFVQANCTG